MELTQVLAEVEKDRLQKAVEGFVSGAYEIRLAGQTDHEVRGFVRNGDGVEYGVALTPDRAFCSCKDSMFRQSVCKHAVILALHVIRTPKVTVETTEEQPVNLKLGKVRKDFTFSA